MNEQTQLPTPKPCPECGGERTFVKYNKQYPNSEIKPLYNHIASMAF